VKLSVLALLALLSLGCAPKKPVRIPDGIPLRIRYNPNNCKREIDQSVTCKANFSPLIVRIP
jgi:hypothetical protein